MVSKPKSAVTMPPDSSRVRMLDFKVLANNWYTLRVARFALRRANGSWQEQQRESYDRGHGATVLLYEPEHRTVVLVRQFRYPAYEVGDDGFLIETAAGLLDEASPEARIRAEAEEETGYRVHNLRKVMEAFMSPGSVNERIHLFVGEYRRGDRLSQGGGLEAEGEDIEVLELPFDAALAMTQDGRIRDGKTIMLLQHAALTFFKA